MRKRNSGVGRGGEVVCQGRREEQLEKLSSTGSRASVGGFLALHGGSFHHL